jgi:hypothetical protein
MYSNFVTSSVCNVGKDRDLHNIFVIDMEQHWSIGIVHSSNTSAYILCVRKSYINNFKYNCKTNHVYKVTYITLSQVLNKRQSKIDKKIKLIEIRRKMKIATMNLAMPCRLSMHMLSWCSLGLPLFIKFIFIGHVFTCIPSHDSNRQIHSEYFFFTLCVR